MAVCGSAQSVPGTRGTGFGSERPIPCIRLQIGFFRVDPDWHSPLFWVNRLVDLGFFIDLYLNLRLMVRSPSQK